MTRSNPPAAAAAAPVVSSPCSLYPLCVCSPTVSPSRYPLGDRSEPRVLCASPRSRSRIRSHLLWMHRQPSIAIPSPSPIPIRIPIPSRPSSLIWHGHRHHHRHRFACPCPYVHRPTIASARRRRRSHENEKISASTPCRAHTRGLGCGRWHRIRNQNRIHPRSRQKSTPHRTTDETIRSQIPRGRRGAEGPTRTCSDRVVRHSIGIAPCDDLLQDAPVAY